MYDTVRAACCYSQHEQGEYTRKELLDTLFCLVDQELDLENLSSLQN